MCTCQANDIAGVWLDAMTSKPDFKCQGRVECTSTVCVCVCVCAYTALLVEIDKQEIVKMDRLPFFTHFKLLIAM